MSTRPRGPRGPTDEHRVRDARRARQLGSTDIAALDVSGLELSFPQDDGEAHVLRGVDLTAAAGETVGIVGESGSGKSTTVLAIAGLLGPRAHPSRLIGSPSKDNPSGAEDARALDLARTSA